METEKECVSSLIVASKFSLRVTSHTVVTLTKKRPPKVPTNNNGIQLPSAAGYAW